jgi:tRNA(Ile)-lysidine synthase
MSLIRLYGPKIPDTAWIACSGGPDSMAAYSFLSQVPQRKIKLAFFHHKTENSDKAHEFLKGFASQNKIHLEVGYLNREKNPDESPEEFWRNERYGFLHALDGPVVTGHNLDDCCETWIFTCLRGNPRLIPYQNKNVIRPFLLTPKDSMLQWCRKRTTEYVLDSSNDDVKYMRNLIRHRIMPHALIVNPGLRKVISKKLIAAQS